MLQSLFLGFYLWFPKKEDDNIFSASIVLAVSTVVWGFVPVALLKRFGVIGIELVGSFGAKALILLLVPTLSAVYYRRFSKLRGSELLNTLYELPGKTQDRLAFTAIATLIAPMLLSGLIFSLFKH